MPLFTAFARRRTTPKHLAAGPLLPEAVRQQLPRRFEAVAEALASGRDALAACAVVGRDVARDGADLGEALDGLRATFHMVGAGAPDFAATRELAVAWSETTLEYLHQLSCEDPLTGLASLAHVRTRLSELYRCAEQTDVSVQGSHALVVVELRFLTVATPGEHQFTRALRLVRVAEALRAVFSGGETIGRVGTDKAVVVVPRTVDLGTSVALLREFLEELEVGAAETRVWIEGLPASGDSAARLLDDLARAS
jgi:GGDEF domain-containing protein